VVGAIQVLNNQRNQSFNEHDQLLLAGFSVYIVQAIAKAKWLKNIDKKENVEGAIAKYVSIGTQLGGCPDRVSFLNQCFKLCTEAMGCASMAIYVPVLDEPNTLIRYDCMGVKGLAELRNEKLHRTEGSMVDEAVNKSTIFNIQVTGKNLSNEGVDTVNANVATGAGRQWLNHLSSYQIGDPKLTRFRQHADFPLEPYQRKKWKNTLIMPFQTDAGCVVIQMANKNQEGRDEPGKVASKMVINFSVQDEELLVTIGQQIAACCFHHDLADKTDLARQALGNLDAFVELVGQPSTLNPMGCCEKLSGVLKADVTSIWTSVKPTRRRNSIKGSPRLNDKSSESGTARIRRLCLYERNGAVSGMVGGDGKPKDAGANRRTTRRGSYSSEIVNINDPEVWPLEVSEDIGVIGKCHSEMKAIHTLMEVDSSELSYDPTNVFSEGTDAPKNTMVVGLLCVPIYKLEVAAEEEVGIAMHKREACLRRSVSGRKGLLAYLERQTEILEDMEANGKEVTVSGVLQFMHTGLPARGFTPHEINLAKSAAAVLALRQYVLDSGENNRANELRLGDIQSIARSALPIRELRYGKEAQLTEILAAARKLLKVRLVCLMAHDRTNRSLTMINVCCDDPDVVARKVPFERHKGLCGYVAAMKNSATCAVNAAKLLRGGGRDDASN